MANSKISALTAGTALAGTEVAPFVQSAVTVKITANQIKTFTSASPTLVTPDLGTPSAGVGTNITGLNATNLASGTVADARLSANVPLLNAANTFAANQVVSGASFGLSGNISAPAWTTAGIRYKNVTATLTDTTSSGTVAAARTDNFGGNTIAASSATTFTKYYSAYFSDPVAGTNVTLTNKSSLGADSISIGGAAQGTNALAVTGTGNYSGAQTFQTASINPDGAVGTPSIRGATANTGIYFDATDILFTVGGSRKGYISTSVVLEVGTQIAQTLAVAGLTTLAYTTATPAGGSTAARTLMGTTAGFGIYYGSGAPSVSAAKGSWYMRSDGTGVADRAYINTDGGTTWTAIATAG